MDRENKDQFRLETNADGDIAYLSIPQVEKQPRKVVQNVRIHELISGYQGPDVIFDFDGEGKLLGIEILL